MEVHQHDHDPFGADYQRRCKLCGKTETDIQDETIRQLVKALQLVKLQGYNEDCLFCGFKDKAVTEVLKGIDPKYLPQQLCMKEWLVE